MKDEEMAKQFADNISGLDLTCSLLSAKDKSHAYRLGRYDGFLAGLKAGRQWHDLRKDKNDLPKDNDEKLCFYGKGKVVARYDSEYGCWDTYFNNLETVIPSSVIIAWCEIPTFDKE